MEYRIQFEACDTVDMPRVADTLAAFDPAAVVDFDAEIGLLRVDTALGSAVLVDLLKTIGHPVQPRQVQRQPSICCGGCGG